MTRPVLSPWLLGFVVCRKIDRGVSKHRADLTRLSEARV